ncbi:MAG: hypothetical protein K0S38_261 [Candidatus Paceibacter sp.]|jgi:hypothetical protein|nr:hypothetical protein [Candidatus Paceibacter sp.]
MKDVRRLDTPSTPQMTIEAYREEFPALDKIMSNLKNVDYVGVELIDVELLDVITGYVTDGYNVALEKQAFFVMDDDPEPVSTLSLRTPHPGFSLFRPSTWFFKNEYSNVSIRDALIRIGDRIKNLKYIVLAQEFFDGILGGTPHTRIQIFKLPKEFSLQQWSENERQKVRANL